MTEPLRLLIVDDDPEIAAFMKMRLAMEAPAFRISCIESSRECIDYVGGNPVDCILADYQMSGMDGMELLRELRRKGNNVPFIFITGQGNEEVATEAFRNGANDYFTKDIGFAHFPRIINSIEQAVKSRASEDNRLRAEAALVEEKNKLESILANMEDCISIQDRDFRVLYQNESHKKIMGEQAGNICYKAYEGEEEVCKGCPIAMAFSDGKTHVTERTVTKGNRFLHVEIAASPLKDASGNIIGGIEAVRDITQRRQTERELKESVEALRDNEQFLSDILAGIQDGVNVLDTDLNFLRVNPATERMYPESLPLVGKKCYEAFHGRKSPCEKCPSLEALTTGHSSYAAKSVRDKGGKLSAWRDVYSFPMLDSKTGQVKGVIEHVRDITERKKTEEKVAQIGRLYSFISETDKAIVRTKDRGKIMNEACRIAVEQGGFAMAWLGMLDRETGTVVPVAWHGKEEGYLSEIRISSYGEIPEGGGPTGTAVRIRGPVVSNDMEKDPSLAFFLPAILKRGYRSCAAFPIFSGENVIGAFAVYSDMPDIFNEEEVRLMEGLSLDISFALENLERETMREEAENALKASEEKARTMAETAFDGIILMDGDGTISYWNPAAERIFGYAADEVLGRDLHGILMPESLKEKFMKVKERGFPEDPSGGPDIGRVREFLARRKDGTEFPVEVTLSSVMIKGRMNFVGVVRDISERKKAQEDTTALFHMLTHDIKGPLSVIYGYVGMIQQVSGQEVKDMISEVQKAAKRISLLIDDMLSLSRLESKQATLILRSVLLSELLQQTIRDTEAIASEKEVTVSLEVAPDVPKIYADSDQLSRAFTNLITNAVIYNKRGGKVEVTAGHLKTSGTGKVYVEIADTGEGISEEDLPHLFKKYYRGKTRMKQGTGLGLAIVKAAVDAHGGSVKVESRKGEGSKFRVVLPVKPGLE